MAKKKGKGKAPKGRAATKQKAKRGASGAASSPFASHFIRSSGWQREGEEDEDEDDGNERAFIGFKGFAQTKHPHHAFSPRSSSSNNIPNLRLRHQAITFVSASPLSQLHGEVEETEVLEVLDADSEEIEDDGENDEEEDNDLDLAASLHTNIITETQEEIAKMKLQAGGELVEDDSGEAEVFMSDGQAEQQNIAVHRPPPTPPPFPMPLPPLPFLIDSVGDASLAAAFTSAFQPGSRRDVSPTPSNSSGEVVLFHGRGGTAGSSRPDDRTSAPFSVPISRDHTQRSGGDDMAKGWAAYPGAWEKGINPNATWAPAPAGSWWTRQSHRADLDTPSTNVKTITDTKATYKKVAKLADMIRVQAEDSALPDDKRAKKTAVATEKRGEAIMQLQAELGVEKSMEALRMAQDAASYVHESAAARKARIQAPSRGDTSQTVEETIASLQADWKAVVRAKRQGKRPATSRDFVPLATSKTTRRGKRGGRHNTAGVLDASDFDDDDDAAGEAAYDDYMANLAAQDSEGDFNGKAAFAFSAPDGGPSLFVNGNEVADDQLLDRDESSEEDFATAMNGNESSSDYSGPLGEDLDEISDIDSSELEENLEYTEQEQWEDEEDLRRRRQERMTDEQIARIFAKQEELGIHGDDMVLEDGNFGDSAEDMDGVGDVDAARAGLANYSFRPAKRRDRSGHFPNASAFADTLDQYGADGFDIMDFDRPSLRNTKNGRKGAPPPELEGLSDEELKANMMSAWENDRSKKRLKKAEREELRMQGLLGAAGKKGKADLNQKYSYGITLTQVHEELHVFLQDPNQQARAFPAMAKNDRKTLHELSLALGLHSKSVGAGINRKPVVYKTHYTPAFDHDSFLRAVSRSERGFLNLDSKLGGKSKGGKPSKTRRGPGGGLAAASIRDGEVVGAGAAQIGTESRGYKLLAKMGGWKPGMALGKEGEGRLEPVEQVMRAGRGGLGDR